MGRLPSGYTEVEYIESTGTQYIDTGLCYNPAKMTSVKVTYYLKDNISYDNKFFGSYSGVGLSISSSNLRSSHKSSWGWNLYPMRIGDHTDEFIYDGTNLLLYHDGLLVETVALSEFTDSLSLLIGKMNRETSYSNYIQFKGVEITGETNANFVPCIRKSDSAVGMYDIVNGVFYGNSGSGMFIAGPVVSSNTIKVYNGSEWVDGTPYVYTSNGWVEADTVYVYTENGWVEKD